MTTSQHFHRLGIATAVVLVLATSGCGSSGGSSGEANGKGSSGGAATTTAEPAAVTLKKGPFCNAFDAGTVTSTLHATAPLTLTRQLEPGQSYTPFRGVPPSRSHYWECAYTQQKMTHPFYSFTAGMSGGVPYDEKRYDADMKALQDSQKRDPRTTCEPTADDDTLGRGGSLVVCSRPEEKSASSFSAGYATVSYYAWVKGTKLFCGVSSSDDKDIDAMKVAAADLCGDFHDAVTP